MTDRINPDTMYNSVQWGFSHAAISEPGRLLHLAGQVAWDADGALVGPGDLAAQARQCLANLKAVLADQGLGPQHLVRIRTYVVNHTPDKLEPVGMALGQFWGDVIPAPNTWIGVQALALPDFLIEIEGTAALS
jgi:enamine deaminase RidA (YjgF/YER057c/UK114 family)